MFIGVQIPMMIWVWRIELCVGMQSAAIWILRSEPCVLITIVTLVLRSEPCVLWTADLISDPSTGE